MSSIPNTTCISASKPEHTNKACEPCRALKVRCLPNPDPLSTRCQRCAKTGRTCHYAAPQKRRPRKRTDTRVAELEREVRAMRSLLGKANQRNSPGVESINEERPSTNTSEGGQDQTEDFMRKISVGSGGRKFLGNEILGGTSSTSNSSPDKGKGSSTTSSSAGGQRPSLTTIPSEGSPTSDDEKSADVIDRGVIDINVAKMYLDHYRNEMVKHAPIVALRPEETFDVLRTVKPVLFLVILAAAAGQKDHAMYQILHEECLHVYAEKYILQSEKTLELVQCFLLTSVWLFPPDDFRALKFYQYVHMAAAMMLDIGHVAPRAPKEPESKPKPEAGVFQGCGDETSVFLNLIKKDDPLEDMRSCYKSNTYRGEVAGKLENEIEVVESRRTYLACYLLCSNVALSLRRPNMLPWSSFTTTCSNFLAHSDYALEADSYLVAWSEMQHIAEDCGQYFAFDDPTVPPMSDPRLQLTLKGFEKRLEDWKKCVDVRLMTPSLAMHFYQNKIFLQEFAIMVKELDLDNTGAGGALNRRAAGVLPNMESARTNPISPASSNAILVIIESAHASLNAMISMSELVLRSIPVINYVRMAYALVMLIKMSATAVAPGSELGKILAIDSLKVDYYIKEVVARLKAIADYRVAAKFLQVVVKVGMWHYRHMCLTGVKVGQGHQELMEPLLNLVVADDEVEGCPYAREENERKRKETAEKEGKNTPIGRGAYGTHLEHYEGPADGPAPDPFQMGRFNFEQSPNSAPNTAPSSTSNPQSQEQQFSSELQSALGQPGPGQDMQGEWLNGMEQFNIGNGLLPSEMDVDIFALTEGMEFSTADLNSFLPIVENQYAPNGGLGDVGGYNGQNWQWNG